jgi:S-adenosylmethionine hydrolase
VLVSLENKRYWRETTSRTFHGRDIMGPVAAHVAAGASIADLGPAMDPSSAVKLVLPAASHVNDAGIITGAVLYVDQFGNVVTNVQQDHLTSAGVQLDDVLEIRFPSWSKGIHVPIRAPFKRTYADVGQGEYICLLNSENRFEIATNRGSAAAKLGLSGGEHSIEIRNVKRHGAT